MKRASGVLLPLFSLPSPYGIGTMGEAAYRFIDFLSEAGQSYWQLLPMGPTSYGDSPYQSFSTFAGNPYFIDPDFLCRDGLLSKEEILSKEFGDDPGRVDYEKIYRNRFLLLRAAYARGKERYRDAMERFRAENPWVTEYALFMSIKESFGMTPLSGWPGEALRKHDPQALSAFSSENAEEIGFFIFLQVLFYEQWEKLRAYAREKGIRFIGDIPIYVAMDSADVWSEPKMFRLKEDLNPDGVAGVPPDAFSEDGQLWGNPLYDYERMKQDGFGWWIRRIDGASKLYDVIRIDHFRGFESYWNVPADSETAKNGTWEKGPGMDLVGVITGWFPDLSFIAEDLGVITPEVRELLEKSGLPGMKVLEFAFEKGKDSQYLPHNLAKKSVCYLGTHDNDTLLGYVKNLSGKDLSYSKEYLHVPGKRELPEAIFRAGMASPCELFIMQVQDILGIRSEGRINTPGTVSGNWTWRMTGKDAAKLSEKAAALRKMTKLYGRR